MQINYNRKEISVGVKYDVIKVELPISQGDR